MLTNNLFPEHVQPPSIYWSSFLMLYKDLEDSLRFVHPANEHLSVYSFRFYELLLRASTEFESVCKQKLIESNLSQKDPKKLTIKDYYLLNEFFEKKPSQMSVAFIFNNPLLIQPLAEWRSSATLTWYKDYNSVKHNRAAKFRLASLQNVLNSIAALFILIERCKFCPQGFLGTMGNWPDVQFASKHDEWPVALIKHYKNTKPFGSSEAST